VLAVCCAAAVAGCGSGSGPGVLTAPTQVVSTSAGTVAYRELGSGPPLLLIVGAGASMDGWPPSFVDALAAHHTVVVFDNAGVGRTSAVSAPASLSVTAMAGQTSALISALRLHTQ
jgi:pimeloyl-ACP methyl ester carboxylesterase